MGDTGKLKPPVARGHALVRKCVALHFIVLSCFPAFVSSSEIRLFTDRVPSLMYLKISFSNRHYLEDSPAMLPASSPCYRATATSCRAHLPRTALGTQHYRMDGWVGGWVGGWMDGGVNEGVSSAQVGTSSHRLTEALQQSCTVGVWRFRPE